MTEKLFEGLRVIFGSQQDRPYNQQIECWARTEYGTDWQFAYNHIMDNHKKPIKGKDY